ncbi:MAG: nucleoside hydrolase [Candidatus Omnitrophica bacterium]|nr:nucleoside hydrolase [Candidatus Omnitrophota bacterium]
MGWSLSEEHRLPGILFDTDAGIDDVVALLILLTMAPERLRILTAVHGNFTVEEVVDTVRGLLYIAPSECAPLVVKGSYSPPQDVLQRRRSFHGKRSPGNFVFPRVSKDACVVRSGTDEMVRAVKTHGVDTIIACGPLTNIAAFKKQKAELSVGRIVISGGWFHEDAVAGGYPDFNISADPEGAEAVFSLPAETVLVPLKVSARCFLKPDDISYLGWNNSLLSGFLKHIVQFGCAASYERFGCERCFMHDAVCALVALEPGLAEYEEACVSVMLSGPERGMLKRDCNGNQINLCTDIDIIRCKSLLLEILRRLIYYDPRGNSRPDPRPDRYC